MLEVKHRNSPDVILLRVDEPTLDGADLSEAWLACAVMQNLRCRQTSFRGANLRAADLRQTDLSRSDFTGANLRGADLRNAILDAACLSGADLTGADLAGADVRGADFSDAVLLDTDLSGIRHDAETRWPEGTASGLAPSAAPPAPPAVFAAWARSARSSADAWGRRYGRWARRHTVSLPGLAGWCAAAALLGVLVGERVSSPPGGTSLQVARQEPAPQLSPAARPPAGHRNKASDRKPLTNPARRVPPRVSAPEARASAAPRLVVWRRVSSARLARREDASARVRALTRAASRKLRFHTRIAGARLKYREAPRRKRPEALVAERHTRPTIVLAGSSAPPAPLQAPRMAARIRRSPAVQVAWGNVGFHYGSGYDIYGMHLTAPP